MAAPGAAMEEWSMFRICPLTRSKAPFLTIRKVTWSSRKQASDKSVKWVHEPRPWPYQLQLINWTEVFNCVVCRCYMICFLLHQHHPVVETNPCQVNQHRCAKTTPALAGIRGYAILQSHTPAVFSAPAMKNNYYSSLRNIFLGG